MIVMHGLLGYRANFQTICRKTPISTFRKSYCVAMRNHAMADHHDEHNYNVMADDVIRFADEQGLDKFTVMGHSMGGRTAMTIACRYPERVDGVISIDAAPVDESFEIEQFGSFAQAVLDFLFELKEENQGITYNQVMEAADKFFNHKPQLRALVSRSLALD